MDNWEPVKLEIVGWGTPWAGKKGFTSCLCLGLTSNLHLKHPTLSLSQLVVLISQMRNRGLKGSTTEGQKLGHGAPNAKDSAFSLS